jgi:hypothetical protein
LCAGDLAGVLFAIVGNLRIADYPPTDLGLCLIATYRQLCTLLFVQDLPLRQQAEAQRTSQKVGSGACDDRRNNVPDIRGRHDGFQRSHDFSQGPLDLGPVAAQKRFL